MGKKCASSLLRQVLVLLLVLCVFPCLSQSAPFSVAGSIHGKTELITNEDSPGRILYQSAKPATLKVKVRTFGSTRNVEMDKGNKRTQTSSRNEGKTHQLEGRRLMSIYLPNAGIRVGPSKSGPGGGRNPSAAP